MPYTLMTLYTCVLISRCPPNSGILPSPHYIPLPPSLPPLTTSPSPPHYHPSLHPPPITTSPSPHYLIPPPLTTTPSPHYIPSPHYPRRPLATDSADAAQIRREQFHHRQLRIRVHRRTRPPQLDPAGVHAHTAGVHPSDHRQGW